MPVDPTYLKVFADVASNAFMFELLNLPIDASPEDRHSGAAYAGRWFEIQQQSYHEMLEILPPLFMRNGMFAPSERKAGNVASTFFEITIAAQKRWFHAYCDLSDKAAPDAMRAAILFWETGDASNMTRDQKLDAIWASTHPDFRGTADGVVTATWPQKHRSDRTILVYEAGAGTVLKFLDALTDEEIEQKLPSRRQP